MINAFTIKFCISNYQEKYHYTEIKFKISSYYYTYFTLKLFTQKYFWKIVKFQKFNIEYEYE